MNYQLAQDCAKAALAVLDKKKYPQDWAQSHSTLALTYKNQKNFKEALASFEAVLEVRTKADAEESWAKTNINFGNLLIDDEFLKQNADKKLEFIDKAIKCFDNGLSVFTKKQYSRVFWAVTLINLSYANIQKSLLLKDNSEKENLLNSTILNLDRAAEVVENDPKATEMARLNYYKGWCNLELARIATDPSEKKTFIEEALGCLEDCESVFNQRLFPQWWKRVQEKKEEIKQLQNKQ